jgi:hypothetical protein
MTNQYRLVLMSGKPIVKLLKHDAAQKSLIPQLCPAVSRGMLANPNPPGPGLRVCPTTLDAHSRAAVWGDDTLQYWLGQTTWHGLDRGPDSLGHPVTE